MRADSHDYLEVLFGALEKDSQVERLEPGLSEAELRAIEFEFKFDFPPDLRGVLRFAHPVGKRFPNWRSTEGLQSRLDKPFDGIWFDVEHAAFWLPEWGSKPEFPDARREVVRLAVLEAPRLIPVFGHRYIPSEPCSVGNPVISVHQTDIIYYGNDLADYFRHEFRVPLPDWAAPTPRHIRFWSNSTTWREE